MNIIDMAEWTYTKYGLRGKHCYTRNVSPKDMILLGRYGYIKSNEKDLLVYITNPDKRFRDKTFSDMDGGDFQRIEATVKDLNYWYEYVGVWANRLPNTQTPSQVPVIVDKK